MHYCLLLLTLSCQLKIHDYNITEILKYINKVVKRFFMFKVDICFVAKKVCIQSAETDVILIISWIQNKHYVILIWSPKFIAFMEVQKTLWIIYMYSLWQVLSRYLLIEAGKHFPFVQISTSVEILDFSMTPHYHYGGSCDSLHFFSC